MKPKYVDLAKQFDKERGYKSSTPIVEAFGSWLDNNAHQTIERASVTRLEYHEMIRDLDNGATGVGGILDRLGIPVIDPEPTDEERLTDDIRQLDDKGNLSSARLARELIKRGWAKTKETDDD